MIRVATTTGGALLEFLYDAEAVTIVKTVPGRRWNPTAKHWTIPHSEVRLAATRLHALGFAVTIDGQLFDPDRSRSSGPFVALLKTPPPPLRQPTYRALARVLHPDTGGTTAQASTQPSQRGEPRHQLTRASPSPSLRRSGS